jgi:hypothetical protein
MEENLTRGSLYSLGYDRGIVFAMYFRIEGTAGYATLLPSMGDTPRRYIFHLSDMGSDEEDDGANDELVGGHALA